MTYYAVHLVESTQHAQVAPVGQLDGRVLSAILFDPVVGDADVVV